MAKVGRFRALLGYPTGEQGWRTLAECKGHDPTLWFPGVGESVKRMNLAVAICERCEVQGECLEYALETKQQFGIWGGLSLKERREFAAEISEK